MHSEHHMSWLQLPPSAEPLIKQELQYIIEKEKGLKVYVRKELEKMCTI